MIVGIDEVGRGPWAGPVVFGAVVLGDAAIEGLTDSKKLSKKRRVALDTEIREKALAFGLGWVHAEELDEVGLSEACRLACRRALEQIHVPYTQIIIDGTVNFLKDTGKGPYVTTMKQADLLVPSVSAASIIAKVTRDAYMTEQAGNYPEYGFASHVGYGTAAHMAALKQFGVTPLHRKSFAPVAAYIADTTSRDTTIKRRNHLANHPLSPAELTAEQLKQSSASKGRFARLIGLDRVSRDAASAPSSRMSKASVAGTASTRAIGDQGEEAAALYLQRHGFYIIDRNWKTKWCEVDIIAKKADRIYFVEVKYRKKVDQGGGIAAITPKKLKQMKFAAELWLQKYGTYDAALSVVEVAGESYNVTQFLEQVQL